MPPIPVVLWATAGARAAGEGKALTPRRKDAEGKAALDQRLTIGGPGRIGAQAPRRDALLFLRVLASPRLAVEFRALGDLTPVGNVVLGGKLLPAVERMGSVVAKNMRVRGQIELRYDESVRSIKSPVFKLASWQER